jgi:L,D-peptidoglycan transpeptidase YkuD (ErfK/YbiS/YcfS/YnhG family)
VRRTVVLLLLLAALGPFGPSAGPASAAPREPPFAALVPAGTTQVIRTAHSHDWCDAIWCTVTQAWERDESGHWTTVAQFRSTIGRRGFGKTREGDRRSPTGIFRITVTFSTGDANPGRLPWRRRLPTSMVSDQPGRRYNTWIEQRGRTTGDRPSMRWGLIIDYNHPRLVIGQGPRPVAGKGSGIFMHTSRPGALWAPTLGCTQVGNPQSMYWLLTWLRPGARPRIVQNL